jgi:hypothetical protein
MCQKHWDMVSPEAKAKIFSFPGGSQQRECAEMDAVFEVAKAEGYGDENSFTHGGAS